MTRILLVEDNPDDEALTVRALKKCNIASEVMVARDGAEALEMIFDSPSAFLPELVLLDLKLPKVDGLEVLRRVRANPRTKLLPIVILTSSDEDQDMAEGYRLGAHSYVRKPVDFMAFLEAVKRLGLYWTQINSPPPLQ